MSTSILAANIHQLRRRLAAHSRSEDSDEQLLHAFLSRGDETAFVVLVHRYGPMVLHVCRRILGHEQDAEDAFQATFLVLARKAATLRNKTALAGFLHGTAYRMAQKAKQAAARRGKHEKRAPVRSSVDPADELSWHEMRILLDSEIAHLPESYRGVFVLCGVENLSQAEAGRRLGLKVRTVSNRLAEARRRLQRRLARRGVELSVALSAAAVTAQPASALSPLLIASTIKASLAAATGEGLTGIVSDPVAELAQDAMAATIASKAKIIAVVLLLVATSGSLVNSYRQASEPLAATPPARPAEQPFAGDRIEVKGCVQTPDGKPLADAKIYLSYYRKDHATPRERTISGADGRFRFTFHKAEVNPHYSWFTDEGWRHAAIVAVAAGYGPQWLETAALDKGEAMLRLVKDDVPIEGRVLDLQGRPVAGATVKVAGIRAGEDEDLAGFLKTRRLNQQKTLLPWTAGLKDSLTTGKDGRFRLTGIGRERIVELDIGGPTLETVGVRALTRKGVDEKTVNTPRPEDATLRQDPPRPRCVYGWRFDHLAGPTKPFLGTVRDKETGKPLAGIHVGMDDQYGKGYYPIETITDENGRYRLSGWPKADSYRLVAAREGEAGYLAAYRSAGDTPGFEPITADFELARGIAIQGHLRDKETGKPIRGDVDYEALPENPNLAKLPDRRYSVRVRVAGDGVFRFVALPGPGMIRAINHQGHYLHARLDPADKAKGRNVYEAHAYRIIAPSKAGKSLTYDLALIPGKTRRLSIVGPDGKPLSSVSVYGLRDLPVETRTLDQATCTVVGLDAERPRRLTFLHAERKLAGHVLLRGDEPEPVTVKLECWGALTGRVVNAEGRPIAGAKIDLFNHTRIRGEISGSHRPNRDSVLTDREGRFRVAGLVPRVKYLVFAYKKELPPLPVVEIDDVMVEAGQTRDLGEVRAK